MTDPYHIVDGKLVPNHAASRAYAAELEARVRAEAAQHRRPIIVRLVASIAPVVMAKLGPNFRT